MLYLSHLIRVKGDIEQHPFVEVMATTPWFALRHFIGHTCRDAISAYHNASRVTSDGIHIKGARACFACLAMFCLLIEE